MEFKVGDRVYHKRKQEYGTVLETGDNVAVVFDNKVNMGHDCQGQCEFGYGWLSSDRFLLKITEFKDTRLARKMYPKAEILENGMLRITNEV